MDGVDMEGTLQGLGPEHLQPPGAPGTPRLEDPTIALDLAHYAEMLSQYAAVVERPYYEAQDELSRLESLRQTTPELFRISGMCLPRLDSTCRQIARSEAMLGTAQIAAALRLYRDAQNAYPASLDELRSVLPAPPVDPFTGKPFLYRREGSGFVVYSAGAGGANSGGVAGSDDILFRSPR